MLAFNLLTALSSVAIFASAAPPPFPALPKLAQCDTSAAKMDLPAGQTALVAPAEAPKFVTIGVGIQNYTCSAATSKYTSIGAVASIFDISCLAKTPALFKNVDSMALKMWKAAPASVAAATLGDKIGAPIQLGHHYFVPSPSGTGISPKWDFKSGQFVVAAKLANIPAPADPATNVDWLVLNSVQGDLASKVFRVDTAGGQPPSSCTPGSPDIQVKYTAKYFLY
ncbi:hypothetical protein MIND_00173600 [Mycena indigotica]|uniref:Malate dehydrogenase n=1 Tax=Mycena indigotica TaxID=2126181 RepID=A0A8H6TDD6_9AGAR|nr:uncharacterized protein MIND_00173600 [Mycena indigotica]KAF7316543.1 hypothetical protein MIND_00173600 [Mycena indigotica]